MEYRISKGFRVLVGFICVMFLFIGLAFIWPGSPINSGHSIGAIAIPGLFLIGTSAFIWLNMVRTKVTLDEQTLTIVTLFKSRSILLTDIRGYRSGAKEAFSVEDNTGGKPLAIPQNLANRKDLIASITRRYEDLDALEKGQEMEVLLEDQRFGLTKEDRERLLKTAGQLDGASFVIGFGLILWAILYPNPFDLVVILLFVAPWIAVGVTWYFKGLLKLYKLKRSPYPSVVQLMAIPTVGALIVVCRFYSLYSFGEKAWGILAVGTILVTCICVAACWQAIQTSVKKGRTYLLLFIGCGVYCYSLLVFSNCHYDKSPSTVYRVAITDKRISHGKSTTYYISLSPWGRYTNGEEVTTERDFYEDMHEGDSISVLLNEGKWGVPWYRLER